MPAQALADRSLYESDETVNQFRNGFTPNHKLDILRDKKWRALIPFLQQASSQNCVQILIWNTVINRFVYEVDARCVSGYDASLYLSESGMHFSMSNFHPDYLPATVLMQQKGWETFFANKEHVNNMVVHMDGVYKKGNGEYMHFLQQSVCIETDKEGRPLLLLTYVHDISYLKKERTANFIVTLPNKMKWWNFNFDMHTLDCVLPLSRQEMVVLSYLAKGVSSKEMAKKLFLSPLTIDTHRRHLLKKTNCVNTTGMITYAKLVGLL